MVATLKIIVASSFLFFTLAVHGVVETYQFTDSNLEARYRALSIELRCPKCQNQSIAESNAPISQDLRRILFEQLEAGSSDEEILNYMADRYGEFVRYRPALSGDTVLLWYAPIIFLLLGVGILWVFVKNAINGEGKPYNDRKLSDFDDLDLDNSDP